MEAENIVHSDSMSPASLGICEKLFQRWELKTFPDRGFGQTFPTDPHNTFGSARSVQLPPLPAEPTHHQVVIIDLRPRVSWCHNTARVQIGEAVPPDHAPPGITVVTHVSVEVPPVEQWSPQSEHYQVPLPGTPRRPDILCTAVRPVGTNNSKRPIPNPKAQGSDPLVHRGELQHMAAELGSYKQAHTSSPPLTLGNIRVVEGPAPLKELGSRAQAVRGGEPDYL
ncbi:hypothetical protein L3Q82_004565 [Scortum barcoo]|uniref:Uncharacterized protein n=1 Tax=Scortum barcoo TaxID=214431 RepID=A0ACB8VHL0_9TELE|nr:hypothetical protein L3Q82_004565 [Scortum barcoo]